MQSAAYLFNLAIAANDEGDFFPIMGICLGHEMIAYILNGYANVQNYSQLLDHAYPSGGSKGCTASAPWSQTRLFILCNHERYPLRRAYKEQYFLLPPLLGCIAEFVRCAPPFERFLTDHCDQSGLERYCVRGFDTGSQVPGLHDIVPFREERL
jgi:hypothetical protein